MNGDTNGNRVGYTYSRYFSSNESRSQSSGGAEFQRGKGLVSEYSSGSGSSQSEAFGSSQYNSSESVRLVAIMTNGNIIGDSIIQHLNTENNTFNKVRVNINQTNGTVNSVVNVQVNFQNLKYLTKDSAITLRTALTVNSRMLMPIDSVFRGVEVGNSRRVPIILRAAKDSDSVTISIPCQVIARRDTVAKISADSLRFLSGSKPLQTLQEGQFKLRYPKFSISIPPMIRVQMGSMVSVPITLNISSPNAQMAGTIQTDLEVNASMLEPLESTPQGLVMQGIRIIPLVFQVSNLNKDTSITYDYKFRAVLGNDNTTALKFRTPQIEPTQYSQLNASGGTLTIQGINTAGGAMRFISQGKTIVKAIFPNPFINDIRFAVSSDIPANIEFELYNYLGTLITRKEFFIQSGGETQIQWQLPNGLTKGMYMILCRENKIWQKTFLVQKE